MALQLEPPAPPPRRSVSTRCDLHPGETFTGFCAACLRERLSGLEASASVAAAPGRKSTSAIRSLFSRTFVAAAAPSASAAAAVVQPDLRRCKSFSCGPRGSGDSLGGGADEPQRRSCDVRGRSTTTLWALFHQDDRERVRDGTAFGAFPASSSAAAAALAAEVAQPPHPHPPPPVCVPEEKIVDSDEITPVVEPEIAVVGTSGEMEDTEATAAPRDAVRAMKDHIDIDLESQPKKPPPKDLKEIAGSFWLAASVFSKKWQKWRRKQKLKKQDVAAGAGASSKAAAAAMPPPEKPSSKPSLFLRRSRFAGSEVAGGRRSCDTDPRFSLDAGRMSVDDAGFSWDEPRASWDGYLFGAAGIAPGRAPPPPVSRLPPILSAMEDSPATGIVERSDGQIPVEDDSQPEPDSDANIPGGSAQTRDYYMDSSTSGRRRRSLDRASSVRKSLEDPKPVAVPVPVVKPVAVPFPVINGHGYGNGKESPLVGSSEFYHFHHAEDLLDHHHHRRFSTTSLVEDFSASLEAAFHDHHGGHAKKPPRRWRSKAWSLWGLIHRRAAGRRTGASPDDGRAFSELGVRGFNGRMMMMQRCNSNASARSSFSSNSGGGHVKRRRGEEYCAQQVERNRSARYISSPGRAADNGMLRFYLTPVRSASGRRTPGRQLRSQSFARTMLRLY